MSVAYSMGPISFEEIGTLSLNPKASPGKLILKHSSENGCFTCFWQFYKYFLNITQPLNIYWFLPFIIHHCHWSKLVLLFSIYLVYSRFIVNHNNLLYLVENKSFKWLCLLNYPFLVVSLLKRVSILMCNISKVLKMERKNIIPLVFNIF